MSKKDEKKASGDFVTKKLFQESSKIVKQEINQQIKKVVGDVIRDVFSGKKTDSKPKVDSKKATLYRVKNSVSDAI